MPIAAQYNKKQLEAILKRYTFKQLEALSFAELSAKLIYETSQFGSTRSCHVRTAQGVVIEVDELTGWFEKLSEEEKAEILDV